MVKKTKPPKVHCSEEFLATLGSWGVEANGGVLHTEQYEEDFNQSTNNLPIVIDVETDEKDNFVCCAYTLDGHNIHYDTNVPYFLHSYPLIGHNLKFDMKQLIQWGVKVIPEQMYFDTALASYVQNTTKRSHSLKNLCKEYLGLEWPKYKELVGVGTSKKTLDQLPEELVANYNGMDVLGTFRLWKYFESKLTPNQKQYLRSIEIPTARVLMEMELKGTKLNIPKLHALNKEFGEKLHQITKKIQLAAQEKGVIREWTEKDGEYKWETVCECCESGEYIFIPNGKVTKAKEKFNINSKRQIASLLEAHGIDLPKTFKGNKKTDKLVLEQNNHLEICQLLLEYSKFTKLKSTYTEGLLEKATKGRIHCSFNQISHDEGISTGRLSSSNPNLQNIPVKTDEGMQIREVFITSKGMILLEADYSQIEPRTVAHVTKDETFTKAFLEGRDIYLELVEGTGRDRGDGKTFMLALLYGAQAKKLARVFQCSESKAEEIIKSIMSKLPRVKAWIAKTKFLAKRYQWVETLYKRRIPLPEINSSNKWERWHWERVAVNSVIQGSAAEIMKKGLIALRAEGYLPVLTVHDSYLLEVLPQDVDRVRAEVREILENVVKISVPLKISIGVGKSWKECKENEETQLQTTSI